MRRKLLLLVLACLLMLGMATLLSCNEEDCTHTFASEWSSDESHHWHEATCEHTDQSSGMAEHTWDEGTVKTEATATTDGVRTVTCTVCGYSKDVAIPASSHTHTYADTLSYDQNGHYYASTCGHADAKKDYTAHQTTAEVTAPTCTENGYTTHTCACGYTYVDTPMAALAHDFVLDTTLNNGTHKMVCANDSAHTKVVNCEYDSVVTDPTCEVGGYTTHTCACGHSYVDGEEDPIEHDWEIGESQNNGTHEMVCANDETHTKVVNCEYDSVVTDPTCEAGGYTTHTCACGHSYVDGDENPIEHNWEIDESLFNGTHKMVCANDETHTKVVNCEYDSVVTAPTCEDDGYTTYTCECGHSYVDDKVEAFGHDYKLSKSNGDGSHEMICANDSTHVKNVDCDYVATLTDPGCTTGGYTTYTCVCGDSYIDDQTDAAGHTFDTENWQSNDVYHWHEATCSHTIERSEYAAHSYTILVSITLPTCENEGYSIYRCVCGKEERLDVVAAYGQSYGEFVESGRTLSDPGCCKYAVTYSTSCGRCGNPQQKVEYTENHSFYYEKEKNNACSVTGANAVCKPTCQSEGIQHKHCASEECKYYSESAENIRYNDPDAHVWSVKSQSESLIVYKCDVCESEKNTAVVTGDTANITGGNVDEVAIGSTTINMNQTMKDTLTEGGTEVSITAGVTEDEKEKEELLEKYKESGIDLDKIGNKPIYSFTVTGADESNFGEGGKATITIPYRLEEGDDRNNIVVFYISATDGLVAIEADYFEDGEGNGFAIFQTEHFSDYVPTSVKVEELCELFGKHSGDTHVVAPTCLTGGYTVCLRCGETIDTTAPLGHKWVSTQTKANTCAENGAVHHECAECGVAYDAVIPATGHYYVLESYVAASCTGEGRSEFGCIYCDESYAVTTAQLQHQYVSRTVAPTCTERGSTQKTCTLCADVQTAYVPALGHDFGTEWFGSEEGHYHICTVCGGRDDVVTHLPGAEATEEHAQLCTVCNYVLAPQLTHEHKNMTHFVAVAAGCMQNGNKEYYVCSCGKWFLDEQATMLVSDHTSVVELAKGHTQENIDAKDPTCTESGNTAGVKCSVCNTLLRGNVIISATGHDHAQNVIQPTCEEGGKTVYTCKCGDSYEGNFTLPLGHRYGAQITVPTCDLGGYTTYTCQLCGDIYTGDEVDALGHSYTVDWQTDGNNHWRECVRCELQADLGRHQKDYESATDQHGVSCTVCGLELEAIKDHTHAPIKRMAAVEPGCTAAGRKAYVICGCGQWFFDEDCTQLVERPVDVIDPAKGHTLVYQEQIDPTCQSAGRSEGYVCLVCDYQGGMIELEQLEHNFKIPAHDENGHWYHCFNCNQKSEVQAHECEGKRIEATCTTVGYTEYFCACGYSYVGDVTGVLGHEYTTCLSNNDGTHTAVCERDPRHVLVERCQYTTTHVAASCEEAGYYLHICEVCGYERTEIAESPLGHRFGDWTYVGEDIHERVCANDAMHVQQGNCVHDEQVTYPTCTEGGYTTYTCSVCGNSFTGVPTDAAGHSYEAVVTAPTCEEGGYTTYTCSVCGDSYVGDETPATGHSYRTDVFKPSCEEGGFTRHTCRNCNDTYDDNYTEPAGHRYSDLVADPNCTQGGYTKHLCDVCGDYYIDSETDPLGHSFEVKYTQEPTCTAGGFTEYYCTVCDDTKSDDFTDATGHDYGDWMPTYDGSHYRECNNDHAHREELVCSYNTTVTEPTCQQGGYTTYTCNECGYTYAADHTGVVEHSFEQGNCKWCGEPEAVTYATNTFVLEVEYDADTDRYGVTLLIKNANLAGVRLNLWFGDAECSWITEGNGSIAFDTGNGINLVYSNGMNTVRDSMALMLIYIDGSADVNNLVLTVYEIYVFDDMGNITVPEYTLPNVQ